MCCPNLNGRFCYICDAHDVVCPDCKSTINADDECDCKVRCCECGERRAPADLPRGVRRYSCCKRGVPCVECYAAMEADAAEAHPADLSAVIAVATGNDDRLVRALKAVCR